MTYLRNHRYVLCALGSLLLMLTGCAGSASSRFYTLNSLVAPAVSEQMPLQQRALSIGVGPVKIPDYLERPQIVSRTSANELKVAKFDRWAGRLDDEIVRALAEDLSVLLSTDRVYTFPWRQESMIAYQVVSDIIRFDGILGDTVFLKAHWIVYQRSDKETLARRTSAISVDMEGSDYEALVIAMSRAVKQLSSEIASAVNELARTTAQ